MATRATAVTTVIATAMLVTAPRGVQGQLYGPNACPDGNYCGAAMSPDYCTLEQSAAAYAAWQGYFGSITDSTDAYGASMAYTTGDGDTAENIPAFQFTWHGPPSLVPIAGTYVGRQALNQFFSAVFSRVQDFTFFTGFAPNNYGIIVPSYNCQFLTAQWEEVSLVAATLKPVTKAINTVVYTFLNATYPRIARADVFVDGGTYQDAFCPGQLNCNGYNTIFAQNCSADGAPPSAAPTATTTTQLSVLLALTVLNVILLLVVVGALVAYKKPEASSLASKDHQVELR
jgi:hypothetical protein